MPPFFTEIDGVVFCESSLEGKTIGEIREYGATQNTTLAELKKVMAGRARQMGGNAIINFRYVQKADKGFHLLKWDKERLNCSGMVVRLEQHPGVSDVVSESVESKVCPACAETVKAAAKICRFCGENL